MLCSHMQIHIYIYPCIYMLDTCRHNNKRREKTSLEKYLPLTLFVTFACERELETEQNCNILTPHSYGRQRCVFLVLQGCSTGGPEAHSAGWWLSLLHLISNVSGPQLIRGPEGPFGLAWLSLLHLISNLSQTVWLLSWLSYIIVQRPLNRLPDLWNGMFDRHQAEITLMQFTGHSLPVHQSMSVPWEFYLVPFC